MGPWLIDKRLRETQHKVLIETIQGGTPQGVFLEVLWDELDNLYTMFDDYPRCFGHREAIMWYDAIIKGIQNNLKRLKGNTHEVVDCILDGLTGLRSNLDKEWDVVHHQIALDGLKRQLDVLFDDKGRGTND